MACDGGGGKYTKSLTSVKMLPAKVQVMFETVMMPFVLPKIAFLPFERPDSM